MRILRWGESYLLSVNEERLPESRRSFSQEAEQQTDTCSWFPDSFFISLQEVQGGVTCLGPKSTSEEWAWLMFHFHSQQKLGILLRSADGFQGKVFSCASQMGGQWSYIKVQDFRENHILHMEKALYIYTYEGGCCINFTNGNNFSRLHQKLIIWGGKKKTQSTSRCLTVYLLKMCLLQKSSFS